MTARRRFEIPSTGIDESLQLIGSDPFGGSSNVGLRVPFLSTAAVKAQNGGSLSSNRYLFLAAVYGVPEGSVGRVVGWRQLLKLGVRLNFGGGDTPNQFRVEEFLVTDPAFHFADASAPTYHLYRLGPNPTRGFPLRTPSPVPNLRSAAFRYSDQPALLFQKIAVPAADKFYVDLTAYKPPNGGRPWKTPLSDSHFGTIYDQRTPWRTSNGWYALQEGVEVEGPDVIGLFISVAQTNPTSVARQLDANLKAALPTPFFPGGLAPETQFILNFPPGDVTGGTSTGVMYWRVGGSLIVEIDGGRGSKRGLAPGERNTPELTREEKTGRP